MQPWLSFKAQLICLWLDHLLPNKSLQTSGSLLGNSYFSWQLFFFFCHSQPIISRTHSKNSHHRTIFFQCQQDFLDRQTWLLQEMLNISMKFISLSIFFFFFVTSRAAVLEARSTPHFVFTLKLVYRPSERFTART